MPKTGPFSAKDAISRLDPARRAQVALILRDCPISRQKQYMRAVTGKGGRKNAITAMCIHCCGWERKEVYECTARGCPLWVWRPTPKTTTGGDASD